MKTEINNKVIEIKEEELEENLLYFIREKLDLTGTKMGCEIGQCGACTVLINNYATKSCTKKVKDIINKKVITIEGLSNPDKLHPLQELFIKRGAIQCGYCTPAMVLTAHAFLLRNNNPTREQIRRAINNVLCRCTGYQQIIDAIQEAKEFYN